jgi:hypothetical protein
VTRTVAWLASVIGLIAGLAALNGTAAWQSVLQVDRAPAAIVVSDGDGSLGVSPEFLNTAQTLNTDGTYRKTGELFNRFQDSLSLSLTATPAVTGSCRTFIVICTQQAEYRLLFCLSTANTLSGTACTGGSEISFTGSGSGGNVLTPAAATTAAVSVPSGGRLYLHVRLEITNGGATGTSYVCGNSPFTFQGSAGGASVTAADSATTQRRQRYRLGTGCSV